MRSVAELSRRRKTRVCHIYTVSAPIGGKVLRISHPMGMKGSSLHVGDQVTANETVVALMHPAQYPFPSTVIWTHDQERTIDQQSKVVVCLARLRFLVMGSLSAPPWQMRNPSSPPCLFTSTHRSRRSAMTSRSSCAGFDVVRAAAARHPADRHEMHIRPGASAASNFN